TVLSISLGGLIFVMIQHVVRAGWSAVIRRVAETAARSVWVMALLFLPIAIFAHDIFPWTHEEHMDAILQKKAPYLNATFFYVRAALYFGIWIGLSWFLHKTSVSMDFGSKEENDKKQRLLWKVSSAGVLLYALSQSFAAFDWLMSLQPHWYSTMFGVYYFAGSMLGLYSFVSLVMLGLQRAGLAKTAVTTEHYHDLGKFIFGHTVFWAYIAFSQFMLIWYANIPEEVEFYYHRVHPEHGWAVLSYALPVMNFFVPFFFLLSRHVKRSRVGLVAGAVYTLIVHVLDIFWLVMPTAEGVHFPNSLLWIDVAALVGVGSIFLAVFAWHFSKHRVVAVSDPRIEESLVHENF
ncbi:MAG: hypothetical protein ACO3JL_10905, partial [Myxococcota bacterium]